MPDTSRAAQQGEIEEMWKIRDMEFSKNLLIGS